jgi:hypothetical protein
MTRIGHILAKLAVAAIVLGSDVSAIEAQIPYELRRAAESKAVEHEDCHARLKNFVSELDAFLDSNSRFLDPLLSLLRQHFPLKNCDIETAITISRKSKYFASVAEQPTWYVISFTSAFPGSPPFSGFDVSFALSKASGDSQYPFAQIHK